MDGESSVDVWRGEEGTPHGGAPPRQATPPESDIVQHMLTFLRKRGYNETEEVLSRECGIKFGGGPADSVPANPIAAAHSSTLPSESYVGEMATLIAHMDASSDVYQAEFSLFIFPVFAHSFLQLLLSGHPSLAQSVVTNYSSRVPAQYAEEVATLASFTTAQQAVYHNLTNLLLKNKFVIRVSRPCLKQLEPLFSRLPSIASIIKENTEIEVMEGTEKRKAMELHTGCVLGSASKNERRHKMFYGLTRDECLYALDKRRSRTKEDVKRREATAPVVDRIPLPPLSEHLIMERGRASKEMSKMVVLGGESVQPTVCVYTTLNAHGGVSACDITDDSSRLALGFGDNGISIFALNEAKKMRKMKRVEELEKLDEESEDIAEEMLETESKSVVALSAHSATVYSLNFSPDNRLLLSTAGDKTMRLWSMQMQSNVVVVRVGHPVWQARFCQRGYYYATGSANSTAAWWSTERMYPIRIFSNALGQVGCVDVHPNCNYVVGGSDDKVVRVWDVLSGACVRTFTAHPAPIRAVKFSPCGRYCVSVCEEGMMGIWDMSSHRLVGGDMRQMHTRIPSISFSREGGNFALSRGGTDISFYSLDKLIMHTSHSEFTPSTLPRMEMMNLETHSYETKDSPVTHLHFSRRNLLVAIAAYNQ